MHFPDWDLVHGYVGKVENFPSLQPLTEDPAINPEPHHRVVGKLIKLHALSCAIYTGPIVPQGAIPPAADQHKVFVY